MVKHSFIIPLLLLASPCAFSCYDPAGSGRCGPNGIGPRNPSGYNNSVGNNGGYYDPSRIPPPPITVMLPDRFGALAEAHKRVKLYPASDLSSREEAGREAMRLCRNDGNTDCKIIYRIENGCFAAAVGMMKNGMFKLHFGVDTFPSMAETKAMDLCVSSGMKDCTLAQKAVCSIARPPR